jgi:hypothetical protein
MFTGDSLDAIREGPRMAGYFADVHLIARDRLACTLGSTPPSPARPPPFQLNLNARASDWPSDGRAVCSAVCWPRTAVEGTSARPRLFPSSPSIHDLTSLSPPLHLLLFFTYLTMSYSAGDLAKGAGLFKVRPSVCADRAMRGGERGGGLAAGWRFSRPLTGWFGRAGGASS